MKRIKEIIFSSFTRSRSVAFWYLTGTLIVQGVKFYNKSKESYELGGKLQERIGKWRELQ